MVREVELGENSNLVNEVIGFVKNRLLLRSVNQVVLGNAEISDLATAKKYAWGQVYGEEFFTWADLRSEKMSEVWDVVYGGGEKYTEMDIKLSKLLGELSHSVQKQLSPKHRELLDDVVSDLKCCLYSRAVQGKTNNFFEGIFSAYLSGGWPCGWVGSWPKGSLLVYRDDVTDTRGLRGDA
ncbi:hypothetical protein MRBLPD1_005356 [Pseudomonas brassicacearum]|uniref:hypothetical protein n=1 Tax=Pseudomonas brassicacearum TaxID=930166 RepID=UPI003466EF3F